MYLRKSRADEELGYENTLERHEEMLRNLAAQTGIHVDEAHIFREIVSGESICEAYETGIYDRQTYLERVQKVDAARAELQARVEELEASIEGSEERHQKAVPILTRAVEEMHALEPKEQNDLLKMIIDRIEYEKTESGAAIEPTLRISLKI